MLKGINGGKPIMEKNDFSEADKKKWLPIRKTYEITEDKDKSFDEKIEDLKVDLYEGEQDVVSWLNNFGAKNSNEFINGFHFHCDSFIYANRYEPFGSKEKNKRSTIMYSHNNLSGNYKPIGEVLSDNNVPSWVRKKLAEEYKEIF